MPLPLVPIIAGILATTGVAKTAHSVKKGYDKKKVAKEINDKNEEASKELNIAMKKISSKFDNSLENLGKTELEIALNFKKFETISAELLDDIEKSEGINDIDIPEHEKMKVEMLNIAATEYLATIGVSGIAAGATSFAVWTGVLGFASASTGASISGLSGVAAYNAAMAFLGGGALSAGGFGMAGGAIALGAIAAAPALLILGFAYSFHGTKSLKEAEKTRSELKKLIEKSELIYKKTEENIDYIRDFEKELIIINDFFEKNYLKKLEIAEKDLDNVDPSLLETIRNGYKLAAIITDLITTPLFKLKAIDQEEDSKEEKPCVIGIKKDINNVPILNKDFLEMKKAETKKSII